MPVPGRSGPVERGSHVRGGVYKCEKKKKEKNWKKASPNIYKIQEEGERSAVVELRKKTPLEYHPSGGRVVYLAGGHRKTPERRGAWDDKGGRGRGGPRRGTGHTGKTRKWWRVKKVQLQKATQLRRSTKARRRDVWKVEEKRSSTFEDCVREKSVFYRYV